MIAGLLNRRISILARSTSRDAAGGLSQMWEPVCTTWAAIDIQNSALVYETAEFVSKVTYRITMRYRTDVILDNSKRLRYIEPTTGVQHLYEIKAPLNTLAANRELVLICYELGGSE